VSYKASILVDTPAGFWRLSDAAAATVATDDSGNARPGSYTGSPTLGASSPLTRDVATAMTLDGVDDLMDVPDNAAFDGVADFSLEIWFKTGALSDTNAKLFWKRLGGNGYALHITTATGLLTFECETGAVNNQLNTTVTNWADGVWHHVVATRTGANARIYVDGALVAGPTALTSNSLANTAVLRIGSNDTVNRRFVGSLFGAAYYGAALSAAQVTAHYAARLLWDYATAIVSDQVEVVTVVEVQAMERLGVWTAAGGGLTNTFYCTFLSQIQTSIVPGGIYRRLDSVKQNATALTSRASSALVDANLGSYFLDTPTNRLYVSTSTGANPDGFVHTGAWFTFFLATTSVSLSGQPLYSPVITGSLPTFTSEMPDPLFGATMAADGVLTILNTDGLFDRLSKQYVWRNKIGHVQAGRSSLAYSDFVTIETLRINSIAPDDEAMTLQLEELGNVLNKSIPPRTWGDGTVTSSIPVTNPGADINGLSQPILFGRVADCPLAYGGLTATGKDAWYGFDANWPCSWGTVKAVNRSTRASTTLTLGVDYTASTSDPQLTIINATYGYADYDIIATLTALGTIASPKFGTMAAALLGICGESTANIDTAAFTAADTAAPQILARYLAEPQAGGRVAARTRAVRQRAGLQGRQRPLDLSPAHAGSSREHCRTHGCGLCHLGAGRRSRHHAERGACRVQPSAVRRQLDGSHLERRLRALRRRGIRFAPAQDLADGCERCRGARGAPPIPARRAADRDSV
jgi:hypothetical protein